MMYNLIFIHNIMGKNTKFNLKKVNYHNLLEKKNRKYMILFLLGVIILCALFYFLNKREGMREGKTFEEDEVEEDPIDEVEEEPIDEMEDEDEDEDEVEKPIVEGFGSQVNCSNFNNRKIQQLMGYKFEDVQKCFLKKYKRKHNEKHKEEEKEEEEERKKDIRKGMKRVEKRIEEKLS